MTNKSDPFPAHIRRTGETEVRQPVSEHNRQASQYALNALAAARLGGAAKLVGLLHDMGKYTVRYRGYLENAVCGMGPGPRLRESQLCRCAVSAGALPRPGLPLRPIDSGTAGLCGGRASRPF